MVSKMDSMSGAGSCSQEMQRENAVGIFPLAVFRKPSRSLLFLLLLGLRAMPMNPRRPSGSSDTSCWKSVWFRGLLFRAVPGMLRAVSRFGRRFGRQRCPPRPRPSRRRGPFASSSAISSTFNSLFKVLFMVLVCYRSRACVVPIGSSGSFTAGTVDAWLGFSWSPLFGLAVVSRPAPPGPASPPLPSPPLPLSLDTLTATQQELMHRSTGSCAHEARSPSMRTGTGRCVPSSQNDGNPVLNVLVPVVVEDSTHNSQLAKWQQQQLPPFSRPPTKPMVKKGASILADLTTFPSSPPSLRSRHLDLPSLNQGLAPQAPKL